MHLRLSIPGVPSQARPLGGNMPRVFLSRLDCSGLAKYWFFVQFPEGDNKATGESEVSVSVIIGVTH